ncbi:hypothetical protein [Pseudanabaena yagii]|nr:hypothetical protein [Pseudanabaena yagii]
MVYRWQQQYVLAAYCDRYAKFDYYNEEFMQYLMSDLHQRFIGSLNYNKPLAVGDIFRADNTKTYTVVSINDTRNKSKDVKSVTVIPVRETANSN